MIAFRQTWAIVETDLRKLRHDPYELFSRMTQPVIWILLFGQAMGHARYISTGRLTYLDYIAPGILAQSLLFISIFYGMALIWEKDMGNLYKILVTPAPRAILVLGRALAAGFRSLTQIPVIYLVCYFLDVHLRWELLPFLGVCAGVLLGAALFSTFSLIIAVLVKKRERFMGMGQVLTMPLFFASNALYPIEQMPSWILFLARINPLTYLVDIVRTLMIVGEASQFGLLTDYGICFMVFCLFVAIATWLYPRILY